MTDLFVPADRDSNEEFSQKLSAIQAVPWFQQVLDAMPSMVMVIDDNRRIVAVNRAMLGLVQRTASEVLGKRPGEAIGCIYAGDGRDGCGTGQHCTVCGAFHAVLESQSIQQPAVRECRVLVGARAGPTALDLRVTATPLLLQNNRFSLVGIEDVSQAKRLAVLQRTFFHDVANTIGCIQGLARYPILAGDSNIRALERITYLAEQLMDEIRAHRDLLQAESGDLAVHLEPVLTAAVLDELHSQWSRHEVSAGKNIRLRSIWRGTIVTDRQLLKRVLGNMVKNALEATHAGRTVSIDCLDQGEEVIFAVHNQEVMPPEVQLQVFQRSFSTTGEPGRGIGTHSMKLFGERYLGGRVDFVSRAPEGTTFRLAIVKTHPSGHTVSMAGRER